MNISNVLCSAAAVLVAAALPIRSAQAQVPASHAVGSPWFEQAEKTVQDCGAAYHGPLTGGTKAAADAAARQFDQFLRKCYPQIDEYYAAPAMLLELANNRFANAAAAALTPGKHIIVACGDVTWSERVVSGQGCAIR